MGASGPIISSHFQDVGSKKDELPNAGQATRIGGPSCEVCSQLYVCTLQQMLVML